MQISIVIPCYNSEHTIRKVVELAIEELRKIPDCTPEIVLVNDYSKDHTWEEIRALSADYPDIVKGIDLSKNFGQHAAIMCGLRYTHGEYVIGMDDDMQNHPSQIPAFLAKAEEGYDVVFGVFKERKFNTGKNITGWISRKLLWKMIDRPEGIQMGSYWLARRYVVDKVLEYDHSQAFIQLLFFRTTSNIADIDIEHFARESGSSGYTFRKGLNHFLSFINYSIKPLHFATYLGVLFSLIGLVAALVVFINKMLHPSVAVGWSSIMCAMLILFGMLFLMLGILGEYIGRLVMGMNETPQYVVREETGSVREPDFSDAESGDPSR